MSSIIEKNTLYGHKYVDITPMLEAHNCLKCLCKIPFHWRLNPAPA